MKRIILFTVISLLASIFFRDPQKAQAIVKFNTEFQNYYRVNPDGSTHVSFVIKQKNNLSVVYATDFGLNINETQISNVKVLDEGTIVIPEIVKTQNQTIISFPFANKVVGKGKVHSFVIEYDTTDIATKQGNTWQINIPRLESEENVASQTVALMVPEDFPTPAYIDPKPEAIKDNTYYFSGSTLGNKAISAVFGQTQYYQGTLAYHLENDSKFGTEAEIALPPDTAYQTVYYQSLEPRPDSVVTDSDGNYLAKYTLGGNQKIDVKLSFVVKLDFNPRPSKKPPSDDLLRENAIWNYTNGIFTTPEIKNLKTAKSIYDYIVDKMKYDFEKVNRQKSLRTPAAESLINYQSAICTDFSNVFVSLARKAKIPSREIQGYAISENPDLKPISLTQDVLHSWPEYFNYANNTWTQIDPTWANTTRGIDYFNKLDFNHIAFVIHGNNPEYPIPAGGYKTKNEKSKDVDIKVQDPIEFPDPEFSLALIKQENNNLFFTIKNSQGVSFYGNTIVNRNEYIDETEQEVFIPPFGETEIIVKIKKKPILGKSNTKVIIYVNGKPLEQSIAIKATVNQTVIFSIIGGFLAIGAVTTRHIHIRRQKQKTSLYR
jgi:transglutaminase-like putative cysteine protease